MKNIRINESIRGLRKKMNLTQEQLAEALGVTVGAVSKWETALSYPDLEMIVEIADFFEVSVDVLLGTNVVRSTPKELTKRIKSLTREKKYDEGAAEAEKALQKYPYDFSLIYECAQLYNIIGIVTGEKDAHIRARQLYERSLDLLPMNDDEKIGPIAIKRGIASVYSICDDNDSAIKELKNCNDDGINNARIGERLAMKKEASDEALDYLSKALYTSVSELFRITIGYINALRYQGDIKETLEIVRWMRSIFAGIKEDKKATAYTDRLDATLLAVNAFYEMLDGNEDKMTRLLKEAVSKAKKFDASPVYDQSNLKFMNHMNDEESGINHDSLGTDSVQGIDQMLRAGLNAPYDPFSEELKIFLEYWEKAAGIREEGE